MLVRSDGELASGKEKGECTDSKCPEHYQCVTVEYKARDGKVYKIECYCMRSSA